MTMSNAKRYARDQARCEAAMKKMSPELRALCDVGGGSVYVGADEHEWMQTVWDRVPLAKPDARGMYPFCQKRYEVAGFMYQALHQEGLFLVCHVPWKRYAVYRLGDTARPLAVSDTDMGAMAKAMGKLKTTRWERTKAQRAKEGH